MKHQREPKANSRRTVRTPVTVNKHAVKRALQRFVGVFGGRNPRKAVEGTFRRLFSLYHEAADRAPAYKGKKSLDNRWRFIANRICWVYRVRRDGSIEILSLVPQGDKPATLLPA